MDHRKFIKILKVLSNELSLSQVEKLIDALRGRGGED